LPCDAIDVAINPQLLDILCCPSTKVPLRLLRADELEAVNRALASAGDHGAAPSGAWTAGLITRDRRTLYRIDDDIPVLLADAALAVADIAQFPAA